MFYCIAMQINENSDYFQSQTTGVQEEKVKPVKQETVQYMPVSSINRAEAIPASSQKVRCYL